MTKFYFSALLLCLLTSCSNDAPTPSTMNSLPHATPALLHRGLAEFPSNTLNPYDAAGRVHNALLDTYYSGGAVMMGISSIASRVEALAQNNPEFLSIKSNGYQPVSVSRMDYLLSNPTTSANEVISESALSSRGKYSLLHFFEDVVAMSKTTSDDFEMYTYIANYEDQILGDSLLSSKDKEVMLTSTSIIRYSSHFGKKRPKKNTDPDWDLLISNIVGSVAFSSSGMASAVSGSVILGIAAHQ